MIWGNFEFVHARTETRNVDKSVRTPEVARYFGLIEENNVSQFRVSQERTERNLGRADFGSARTLACRVDTPVDTWKHY